MGSCIIVGAGDFTVSPPGKKEGDLWIAADGGYLYCRIMETEPDLFLGDMDSLEENLREEILQRQRSGDSRIMVLPEEKDDTDMLAAVRIGLERGYREFYLYGAMGGRIEHSMANIQCLHYLKNCGAKGYIMDGNTMLTVIKDETVEFQPSMEGYLSVFALEEKAVGVTIEGLKYPLSHTELKNDYPLGISNEFIGKKSSVSVEKGTLLLVVTWPE